MKTYQAITDAFVAEGVDVVFSLMGDSNMMFHDDLVRRHGTRVVNVRHENVAVSMADGYARATGRVGVATVTCGPGVTQIATALTSAARLRTPIVVFAGDTPSTDRWNPQRLDFSTVVLPTGAVHFPIRSADRIADTVAFAFAAARRDRRPIVVSMPYDLQDLEAPEAARPRPSDGLVAAAIPIQPSPRAVAAAADAIVGARRPVVVAGRGAVEAGARCAIVELADRAGALLATSLKAKDWFDGAAWNIGVCGTLGTSTGRALVAQADVVVGIGAQLGYFNSEAGRLYPQAHVVHVDLEPGRPVEGAPFEGTFVMSDARLGAEALVAELDRRGHTSSGYRTPDVAERIAAPVDDWVPSEPEPGRLDPTLAVRAIDAAVTSHHRYVFGVGHFWSFATMNTHRPDPRDYLYGYGFGAIGQALPMAIGAAVGEDRPVLLIDGDGSVLMHVAELGTAVDQDVDLTIVVMNDGGYGSEIHKLRAKGGDGELARFHDTDFVTVARGFGLDAHRATSTEHLGDLIAAQRQTRRPTLIDVPMAHGAVSPPTRRVVGGSTGAAR